MMKNNDPKNLANFIYCLSILEKKTSLLYQDLSQKIELPLAQTFFAHISLDSQKHSLVLKGVAQSIAKIDEKEEKCKKKMSGAWHLIGSFIKEIGERKKISDEDLMDLSERLTILESTLGEEYYVFVQLKTLQLMMKQVNQIYNLDLGHLRSIFERIIRDEETHRELLGTIKEMLEKKENIRAAPIVKYQNPDSWNQPNTT